MSHVAGALAIVNFGARGNDLTLRDPAGGDQSPLCIDVNLQPPQNDEQVEIWWGSGGPISRGTLGNIRYACDDHYLFAAWEGREDELGGPCATAEAGYREICQFQQRSSHPHLLRMWNFLDAINVGAGDAERYREFCIGRARAMAPLFKTSFPAASAIGRHNPTGTVQVYWIAGRSPGMPFENPRQVAAYQYPREHGPASPSFSRATLAPNGPLFISGTASIIGHTSVHHGDVAAQLEETLRNLDILIAAAKQQGMLRSDRVLKIYVRDPANFAAIDARLRRVWPHSSAVLLAGDICRRELLLEIECVELRS
jgi:chorismate lyase/3-hydroxybenzoate synthase